MIGPKAARLEIDGLQVNCFGTFRDVVWALSRCWDWQEDINKPKLYRGIQFIGGDQLEDYARGIGV